MLETLGRTAVFAVASLGVSCRPGAAHSENNLDEPLHLTGATVARSVHDASTPSTGRPTVPDAGQIAGKADASNALTDPMANHRETTSELLSLFEIKPMTDKEKKTILPDLFLRRVFGPGGPSYMNQGNKAIALHTISKEQCLAGLKNVVLQSPEQHATCAAENMVPVWIKGKEPWFCIDIFEFPNQACELPMVWTPPTNAKKVCELQGKRLCSQTEWNIACRGDPDGGSDRRYAYGDRLDLDICNTNRGHHRPCNARDAKTAWDTCATETEPSGSYPQCRSRFGVYDQHGNVAEVMLRREGENVYTQLKGSAWFYNELAREPNEPTPESTPNKAGAYPDHCNFDPRWHVEKIEDARHVNYHLGFRCCKSIP
ncbi:MAG: SUMF1/EgtB/PvdO family nonheme iron enzyme [Polyangiaceae bacterium]|nr:SUMF1/EgtB/PvdO family nonheme iron enzyme [Polyangiaceae bacterium]